MTVVVAGQRDRFGRMNTELAADALSARNCRLVLPGNSEISGGLVIGMAGVLTWFCAGLYGRRSARNRALKAVSRAQPGIGPRP